MHPSDPGHVTGLLADGKAASGDEDKIEVTLGGRQFHVRRAFLDDTAHQNLEARIAGLRKALLVFHAPTDDTVGIENASHIFLAAKHPKSFISLAGADHLINGHGDAAYVASLIAPWAERYLDIAADAQPVDGETGEVVVRETRRGLLQQEVIAGRHRLLADEPEAAGGLGSGPGPYDLLLAALGACTSMTVRLYADRKSLPLKRTSVRLRHGRIYAADCSECETKEGMIDHIDRVITFEGALITNSVRASSRSPTSAPSTAR